MERTIKKYIITRVIIKIGIDHIVEIEGHHSEVENYRGRPQYVNTYRNDFRRDNFREMQNYRGQNFRVGYRSNNRNNNFGRGRSRLRGKAIFR